MHHPSLPFAKDAEEAAKQIYELHCYRFEKASLRGRVLGGIMRG